MALPDLPLRGGEPLATHVRHLALWISDVARKHEVLGLDAFVRQPAG